MTKATGLIGAFLLAVCAPLAHADFVISYAINSGTATQCADGVDASDANAAALCFSTPTNVGSGITINTLGGSGSQSPDVSQEQGGVFSIKNTSGSTVTLYLYLADQNFSGPTSPPAPAIDYVSNLSITSTTGSGNVTLESCIDTSNGTVPGALSTTPASFCSSSAATLTSPPLPFPPTSNSNTETMGFSSLSSPYSLSQEITLVLNAGASMNFSTSQVLTPVPEPASLILLGSGLLGASIVVRRKMQSKRAEKAVAV